MTVIGCGPAASRYHRASAWRKEVIAVDLQPGMFVRTRQGAGGKSDQYSFVEAGAGEGKFAPARIVFRWSPSSGVLDQRAALEICALALGGILSITEITDPHPKPGWCRAHCIAGFGKPRFRQSLAYTLNLEKPL
jgi:hypothetical protein